MDDYIIDLAKKKKPKICFLATASGDAIGYIEKFYNSFHKRGIPSHLSLFGKNDFDDPYKHIIEQEIIYVGGGNTVNLLNLWNLYSISSTIVKAWYNGTVLCGISAGMNCWFKEFITDYFWRKLKPYHCGMSLLPYSACPHYNNSEFRKIFRNAIKNNHISEGYAAEECVGIVFKGIIFDHAISSNDKAKAYYLKKEDNKVIEEELNVVRL